MLTIKTMLVVQFFDTRISNDLSLKVLDVIRKKNIMIFPLFTSKIIDVRNWASAYYYKQGIITKKYQKGSKNSVIA